MDEIEITTVKELKDFLNSFSNDTQVVFADRDNLPCRPCTWRCYSNAKEFIESKIIQEWHDRYLKDMYSMGIKDNAVVIKASF